MVERAFEDGVRTRLILSGISELCCHGVRDFSLRRVALTAEVSCAAPYRHFKDKDELILEIIKYIFSKWQLLCREIESAYSEDTERLIVELAAANVAFWAANGNFRSVLTLEAGDETEGTRAEMRKFDAPVVSAIRRLGLCRKMSEDKIEALEFFVTSLVYGTVMLIISGRTESTVSAVDKMRAVIEGELKSDNK